MKGERYCEARRERERENEDERRNREKEQKLKNIEKKIHSNHADPKHQRAAGNIELAKKVKQLATQLERELNAKRQRQESGEREGDRRRAP